MSNESVLIALMKTMKEKVNQTFRHWLTKNMCIFANKKLGINVCFISVILRYFLFKNRQSDSNMMASQRWKSKSLDTQVVNASPIWSLLMPVFLVSISKTYTETALGCTLKEPSDSMFSRLSPGMWDLASFFLLKTAAYDGRKQTADISRVMRLNWNNEVTNQKTTDTVQPHRAVWSCRVEGLFSADSCCAREVLWVTSLKTSGQ